MSQPLSRTVLPSRHDARTSTEEESAPVACIRPVPIAAPAAGGAAVEPGLFEHVVCRVGGLPVDVVERMGHAGLADALDGLDAAEAAMAAESEVLAEALYAAVGAVEERRRRHRLLQLRRDVHNRRRPRRADLAAGRQALAGEAAAALDRFAAASRRREEILAGFPDLHATALSAGRRHLRRWIRDADFRNGLLLSSRVLSDELDRYLATPPGRLTAKERQIERGLLRYFSRMAMKTTPFGSFTALLAGRLVDRAGGVAQMRGDPRTKRSLVRLNKRLFGVLVSELLEDAEVRRHLGVELNPTLHREPGSAGDAVTWRFLAGRGTRETFQRIAANPVLDLYRELLAGSPRPLGELEDRLLSDDRLAAGREEVEAFTGRLIEVGLLRLRTGVPAQEAEWDRPLRRLLAGVPGAAAERTRGLLDRLREVCDAFGPAAVGERGELLRQAAEAMRAGSPALAKRAEMHEELPLYEDCGGPARLEIPRRSLAEASACLLDYVRLTAPLAWPRHEQIAMRHFFDGYYDGRPVPLLRFYEDYYREHFKGFLEREREAQAAAQREQGGDDAAAESEGDAPGGAGGDQEGGEESGRFDAVNPFGLEVVRRMQAARRILFAGIRAAWRRRPQAETLAFTRADLEEAMAGLPPVHEPCFSTSAFAQLLPGSGPNGTTALLVGPLLRGYGKYFSRFLDVLPPEVLADLQVRNAGLGDALLADIGSDGDFNANLHPPLVPWEIAYPTAEGGAAEAELRVPDLTVEPATADPYGLVLRHAPSGRRVVPLDLGFQNPRMRPPLYQLLAGLAPGSLVFLPLPEHPEQPVPGEAVSAKPAEGGAPAADPRVVYRPRIVYDGCLILERRRWSVPRAVLPQRQEASSDADHLLRLDAWRRHHGMPREVFASIRNPRFADGKPRRDLHKPQYLDFADPLLVELLTRTLDSLSSFELLLYERLPRRDQLPVHGGRRYATELVLQVDFPGGVEAPAPGEAAGGGDA